MKKVLLATLAVAAFVATSAEADIKVRPYVSAKIGHAWANQRAYAWDAAWPADKAKLAGTDNVWMGAYALGVKVCAFRAEFEYNHWGKAHSERAPEQIGFTRTGLRQQSWMMNGYFDIPTKTAIRPYVGAGVGLARIRGRMEAPEDLVLAVKGKTAWAWQVGAGIGYNLTKNLTLDVGYRYVNNGNLTIKTIPGVPVKFHARDQEVLVGLRYTF
jgi:opacity protein-like surface antigen